MKDLTEAMNRLQHSCGALEDYSTALGTICNHSFEAPAVFGGDFGESWYRDNYVLACSVLRAISTGMESLCEEMTAIHAAVCNEFFR